MKKNVKNFESGQALIVIVFALVGLIGMIALTVDGGFAYSDHRHAQNAADTAAFAAARAKIRGEDWKAVALAMASLNSYVDTDPGPGSSSNRVNVEVYQCTEAHEPGCGTYENPEEYIHVLITSTIDTFFGKSHRRMAGDQPGECDHARQTGRAEPNQFWQCHRVAHARMQG